METILVTSKKKKQISNSGTRPKTVVFFDGKCHLCHGSVNFLLKHGIAEKVQFAPLQSENARKLLEPFDYDPAQLNSILFMDQGRVYEADDAILRVSAYLPAPWSWLRLMSMVPRFIRRPTYYFIAKRRYKWFGKYDHCRLPDPSLKGRFID